MQKSPRNKCKGVQLIADTSTPCFCLLRVKLRCHTAFALRFMSGECMQDEIETCWNSAPLLLWFFTTQHTLQHSLRQDLPQWWITTSQCKNSEQRMLWQDLPQWRITTRQCQDPFSWQRLHWIGSQKFRTRCLMHLETLLDTLTPRPDRSVLNMNLFYKVFLAVPDHDELWYNNFGPASIGWLGVITIILVIIWTHIRWSIRFLVAWSYLIKSAKLHYVVLITLAQFHTCVFSSLSGLKRRRHARACTCDLVFFVFVCVRRHVSMCVACLSVPPHLCHWGR